MNEDMVEAVFDWTSEMRAGNLRFITEVPNNYKPASFRSLVSYKSLV